MKTSQHLTALRLTGTVLISVSLDLEVAVSLDALSVAKPNSMVAVWLSGNIVGRINEVTLRRAGLVLRWVTIQGYTTLVTFHPSGVGKSNTGLLRRGEGRVRSPVSDAR